MKFGEKLYQLRKSAGLSQEEFGNLFNVSRQSVSKWESNQAYPEIQTIVSISEYFNISVDSLVKNIDSNKENTQLKNSFEEISILKMKFYLGCFITIIGVSMFFVYMVVCKEIILYYGDPLDWLFNWLFHWDGVFPTEFIYFLICLSISIFGLNICYKSTSKKIL